MALNNLKRVDMPLNKETKPSSRYNGDNFEMLIRILHSFLNRSINIIIDCPKKQNPYIFVVSNYGFCFFFFCAGESPCIYIVLTSLVKNLETPFFMMSLSLLLVSFHKGRIEREVPVILQPLFEGSKSILLKAVRATFPSTGP